MGIITFIFLLFVSVPVCLCHIPTYFLNAYLFSKFNSGNYEIKKTEKDDGKVMWTLTSTCDGETHEKISDDGTKLYAVFAPFEHICLFRNCTQAIKIEDYDDRLERGHIVAKNESDENNVYA